MKEFAQIKKNLKKDFSSLNKVRVAILGDTSTQFLTQAIRGLGFDDGYNLEVWEADFDQVDGQIFNQSSELHKFKPEFVVLFLSSHKLLSKYNKLKSEEQSNLANKELERIESLSDIIITNLKSKLIFYNYTEINDSVFGSFGNKISSSFIYQLRKLNLDLMEFASRTADFHICDLSSIQNLVGKSTFFVPSIYTNTEMVLGIDVLPYVAQRSIQIINAIQGKIVKCLILDLDNTMWGGVIGDDGIENIQIGSLGIGKAFSEFQYWVKKLKERGIILAVCSKNTESIAKEPFEKHPDMVLSLDDISVFVANWDNKPDNIRSIREILNIGFDSMVFLDDNPFERNIVRENIPEICVPELPEDPAEYLEYLYSLNLFETTSFSNEDVLRTKLYQTEAKRTAVKQKFTNEEDFLKSLEMQAEVSSLNKFNIPRIAQLSQRSNQFNLRTIRYSEEDLFNLSENKYYNFFSFSLKDKYGDNGLIAVVILKHDNAETVFIENWFMSCRVLKRNMENFTLNTIVDFAIEKGYNKIKAEYIATPKNDLVKNHYQDLGFTFVDGYWFLETVGFNSFPVHITKS